MASEEKKELIGEVERRLEFVITLAIFFPSLLYSLFNVANESEQNSNGIIIKWGLFVSFYIIDYIIFQIRKKRTGESLLEMLKILLLIGIGIYIIPIWDMAIYGNGPIYGISALLFKSSLWILLAIPLLLIILLLTEDILIDIVNLQSKNVRHLWHWMTNRF
ncbi:MAG TPA: hypothetical protein VHA30_00160 [Patescibacteria group bacterium]|nr:hypothetical protein [Patescibacteria group bacterium]